MNNDSNSDIRELVKLLVREIRANSVPFEHDLVDDPLLREPSVLVAPSSQRKIRRWMRKMMPKTKR